MRYFEIGKIVNTQGIGGKVRVVPSTDEPRRFELLDSVTAVGDFGQKELKIESVAYHKQFVILKLYDINDMSSAEYFKGSILKIPESLALPLEDGEYYIRDLIGLAVRSDTGEDLGRIKDIIFTGANDVYVIEGEYNKELLLPAIKQCILRVDVSGGIMIVHIMEGL